MADPIACDVCGQPVEQPRTNRRLRHRECNPLREDIERVRRHLEALADGSHPVQITPRRLAAIRYDLICLLADLPRVRDKRGRFRRLYGERRG